MSTRLSISCWWKVRRQAVQRINLIRVSFWCFDVMLKHSNVKITDINSIHEVPAFKEPSSPVSWRLCHQHWNFSSHKSNKTFAGIANSETHNRRIRHFYSLSSLLTARHFTALSVCCCIHWDASIFTSAIRYRWNCEKHKKKRWDSARYFIVFKQKIEA